jgi:mono/diheme cytochrome c family protein
MRIALFTFLAAASLLAKMSAAPAASAASPSPGLIWDPPSQDYTATNGQVGARFTFKVRNASASDYVIDDVTTSCECTTAGMPSKPWHLAPGETNKLETIVDLRDHMSGVTSSDIILKDIYVFSTNATNTLSIAITIPPGLTNTMTRPEIDRLWGQQLAAVDRQAVFKNSCVSCHLVPAFGKKGENLYHTTCGICHDDAHRAPMVPDLHALKAEIDTNYWRTWITYGKPGTLMPAFVNTEGGPLEAAQIDSLVKYMTNAFPRPMKGATNAPAR